MFCLSLSVFAAYVALSSAAACNLSNGNMGTCMHVGQCASMPNVHIESSSSCTSTDHACCGSQGSSAVVPMTPTDQSPELPLGLAQCTSPGFKEGQCIDAAQCPTPFAAYKSSDGAQGCQSFASEVQCCAPTGVDPSGGGSTNAGCAGARFPLAPGSLLHISVNWGGSRGGGSRCHAGLDIYTSGARRVVNSYAGVVTNILRNWYPCSRGQIDAIFVYMTSGPLAGKTINYGEINPGTYNVRAGQQVSTGQDLGIARNCGMLHFELYQGRRTANSRWHPGSGGVGSGCHIRWMGRKPAALLDPRPFLQCTAPAGYQTRPGTSFLMDADLSALEDDDEADDVEPMAPGVIIAIATVITLIVLSLIVLALVVVKRRRSN